MLLKSLAWRKENGIDEIPENDPMITKYRNKVPVAWLGTEKESGCPVFLCLNGRQDFRSIIEEDGVDGALKHVVIVTEAQRKILKICSERTGRPITQIIEIFDLERYSLRQIGTSEARAGLRKIIKTMEDNYPEGIKSAVVLNAPRIFTVIFNFIKPLTSKATLEKIVILGRDPEKWKVDLSTRIPMELVPKHWGGSLAGNDEYCSDSDIWLFGPLGPKFFSNGKTVSILPSRKPFTALSYISEGVNLCSKFPILF
jgi:hypothetical protein